MTNTITFEVAGHEPVTIAIRNGVIAGWTGRNMDAVQHHIDELKAIGVPPPSTVPLYYRVASSLLTTDALIETVDETSSGEAEPVLLDDGANLYLGLGSDHTDRAIEHAGITVAKQVCDKPIGATFWPMDEVSPHWDRLTLRSWITENGARVLYQDGSVGGLLSPDELLAAYAAEGKELAEGMLMFGGTCGAIGGVRHAPTFEVELADPVLGRSIRHAYRLTPLEILG